MPLPVIPFVFRCSWDFSTFNGVTPANVFHVFSSAGTDADIGELIWASAPEGLLLPVHEGFEPTAVTVLPLDGVTAGVTVPKPPGGPTLCQGDGQFIAEAAVVLKMATGVRGPSGRGRQFLGPIGEGTQQDGLIVGDTLTDLVPHWADFRAALAVDTTLLVVASYTNESSAPVLEGGFNVNPGVCLQRRRLLQLRS